MSGYDLSQLNTLYHFIQIKLYLAVFSYLRNIMGANSIDISQYRSRIGTFAGKKSTCNKSQVSSGNKFKTNTAMESFIILSYLLVLSNVIQTLLIISGLEMNPGPFNLGKK